MPSPDAMSPSGLKSGSQFYPSYPNNPRRRPPEGAIGTSWDMQCGYWVLIFLYVCRSGLIHLIIYWSFNCVVFSSSKWWKLSVTMTCSPKWCLKCVVRSSGPKQLTLCPVEHKSKYKATVYAHECTLAFHSNWCVYRAASTCCILVFFLVFLYFLV